MRLFILLFMKMLYFCTYFAFFLLIADRYFIGVYYYNLIFLKKYYWTGKNFIFSIRNKSKLFQYSAVFTFPLSFDDLLSMFYTSFLPYSNFVIVMGPICFLLFFLFYFFFKFIFYEKNILALTDEQLSFITVDETAKSTYNINKRLVLLNYLVLDGFRYLKYLFFIFFLCMFCCFFFIDYIFETSSIYGFFTLFSNIFFVYLLLGVLMFIFFSIGTLYAKQSFMLNVELPFLYGFAIVIFMLALQVNHLLLLFLCLEIFSYTLYILVTVKKYYFAGEIKNNPLAIEAGIKYFIMGSLSSLILIFGISIFLMLGNSLTYDMLTFFFSFSEDFEYLNIYIVGFFCIIMYFFFKLSLVPFHWWIPEVFTGTSLLTAFYIAVPTKLVSVILFLHVISLAFDMFYAWLTILTFVFAPISLLIGSLGMFYSNKIKSFIAFSTVYNMSYILIAIAFSCSDLGMFSVFIYLFGYLLAMLLFFIILLFIYFYSGFDLVYLNQLSIIKNFNKILQYSLILVFLSMIGVPPLAGFWGKYYILLLLLSLQSYGFDVKEGLSCSCYPDDERDPFETFYLFNYLEYSGILILIIIITSIFSAYIYLRIIKTLLYDNDDDGHKFQLSFFHICYLCVLAFCIAFFYIFLPSICNNDYFLYTFPAEIFYAEPVSVHDYIFYRQYWLKDIIYSIGFNDVSLNENFRQLYNSKNYFAAYNYLSYLEDSNKTYPFFYIVDIKL